MNSDSKTRSESDWEFALPESWASSAAPATPDKCPTCGLAREPGFCGDPWHSGAAPAAKPPNWDATWQAYQDYLKLHPEYRNTWSSFYEGAAFGARAAAEPKEKKVNSDSKTRHCIFTGNPCGTCLCVNCVEMRVRGAAPATKTPDALIRQLGEALETIWQIWRESRYPQNHALLSRMTGARPLVESALEAYAGTRAAAEPKEKK